VVPVKINEFSCVPCRSRTAFDFIPKKKIELNLEKTGDLLEENGFFVEFATATILMLKTKKHKATIFAHGKIKIREAENEKEATKTAQSIIQYI
jgi:TATA-box binding protein (TBP) (component of TFIID and TFIIIB)